MGLFNKKQFLKVIEWEDNSQDTLLYRFPLTDRDAIMNSSTLVVRPSQIAVFIHKGQVADIFAPGTYKLSTENIPIISKILTLPTHGEYQVTAEVYYVNTKAITGRKWGTQNPIMMRDNDFGNVRIRAFGTFAFKVVNARKFIEEMSGTNGEYRAAQAEAQVKPTILEGFADAVSESRISALDLAANYREFSKTVQATSAEEFGKFGLELTSLMIENISLPEEVEKALDERTRLGIFSDKMGTYTQMAAADAMKAAASNPNGNNFAGMGVGLGTGVAVGGVMGQALASAQDTPRVQPAQDAPKAAAGTIVCPSCGATVQKGKFCPECGAKLPTKKFCTNCGTELSGDAKFCPECGAKQ
ncbi:MAG: SPFH domain-containing protein [Bacilli bacterium]|nr:SPFH domain-containing protein [Bacilli bacterium]